MGKGGEEGGKRVDFDGMTVGLHLYPELHLLHHVGRGFQAVDEPLQSPAWTVEEVDLVRPPNQSPDRLEQALDSPLQRPKAKKPLQ